MKNKAIIILSLILLFLMITAVSASEVNSTDTVSTTNNFEVSVCENNTGEVAVSALPNTNSENVNNNDGITVVNETSNMDDGLNVSDENPTSNFELEQSNNVNDSVQDELLLGAMNKDILTSSGNDAILGMAPEQVLTASEITISGYTDDLMEACKILFKLTVINDDLYTYQCAVVSGTFDYADLHVASGDKYSISDGATITLNNGLVKNPVSFYGFRTGYGSFRGSSFYLPNSLAADTTVSVTNPSVKYNSGTFSVSGTVT